jgi:hypothetical protein
MLSSIGIRACQAEAPREGMAYRKLHRKFFSAVAFNNSIFIIHQWTGAATLFGWALVLALACVAYTMCGDLGSVISKNSSLNHFHFFS